jgi:leader peptidase (prepilin peptidase)/N-methyltransferase
MNLLIIFIIFLFGSCIGSFLNVVILRLPEDQKLTGRSHCPNCLNTLRPLELVPLFSYLFLSGKCRHCGYKISARYFIIEFITGALFALSWWLVQPQNFFGFVLLIKDVFIISALLAVFVIDLEHYIILDSIVFPAAFAALLLNLILNLSARQPILNFHSYFLSAIVGAVAAPLPFFLGWFFSKGRWMGFGDVKLAIFLGAALGWPIVGVGLMAAVFLGGIVSLILLMLTDKTLKSQVPFGTFLALGSVLALFYGQTLLHWYLAILGF